MNFAVDTRLSVSRVNLRPASLWRSGSEAHDLRHPGQSLLAHLNFGDVGTSEDAFSAHRQVTLLDRRKARGELETADTRSEARRVGKEGVSTCRVRWWQRYKKK